MDEKNKGNKPQPAKVNRFVGIFGAPSFKAEPLKKPFVFPSGTDKGTEQTGLAEVIFPQFGGVEGAAFTACRVVKRVSPDKKVITLALTMPSVSIGPVRHPVINTKNATEAVQREYMDFQSGVLTAYKTWRAEQRKARIVDAKQSIITGGAMTVSNDQPAELGLTAE